jgi:hypothetical protein
LYFPVIIFTRVGVHKGWECAWVNLIPFWASLSKFGVLYETLPLQLKHSYPISSAIIKIILGFLFGDLAHDRKTFCEVTAIAEIPIPVNFKNFRRFIFIPPFQEKI